MFPPLFILKGFLRRHAMKFIGGAIVLVMVLGLYFMYKQNIKLEAENLNLEATVKEKQVQLESVIQQAEIMAEINHRLTAKERELNESLFQLSHKFNKNGRNFEKLAQEKPGLIAPIINKASQETLNCIELITLGKECE